VCVSDVRVYATVVCQLPKAYVRRSMWKGVDDSVRVIIVCMYVVLAAATKTHPIFAHCEKQPCFFGMPSYLPNQFISSTV